MRIAAAICVAQVAKPAVSPISKSEWRPKCDAYRACTNPTNRASVLRINSIIRQGNEVGLAISAAAGRTAIVQSATARTTGAGNFDDLNPPLHRPVNGDVSTNFIDALGAGATARVYRVRSSP